MQNPLAKRNVRTSLPRKIFNVVVYVFAAAGFAIIGAWAVFKLGLTNNSGAVDENYRYLSSVSDMRKAADEISSMTDDERDALWMGQYLKLAAFGRYYPSNARMILEAAQRSGNPLLVDQMMAAATVYADTSAGYNILLRRLSDIFDATPQQFNSSAIPWMATEEWEMLRLSIIKDSALLTQAGYLTGVEPRLIASCLVGEQIRLFNSKREVVKKYLGPVKMLSVQSQFSYGVNGIKEYTAMQVERNLKDTASIFYMGKRYENVLDFRTDDHSTERYNRLVDYRNHLYSYLYTGCILHQTMLQWRRSGYDISDRPDILCTLFNVGFAQSHPHDSPRCGGSHISVDGQLYTFGAIGFDFYYSGDLIDVLPYWPSRFVDDDGVCLTQQQIDSIQSNVSNCSRPEKGLEYRTEDPQRMEW